MAAALEPLGPAIDVLARLHACYTFLIPALASEATVLSPFRPSARRDPV